MAEETTNTTRPEQEPIMDPEDNFAQTRGADDLFESEIQPAVLPSSPPPSALREPRAFRRGGGSHGAPLGDRHLSGGIRKPKLTDDELAARMERIKLNNQRLTERARKAVEDETHFQVLESQRKASDVARRQVERKKRVEQERNRKELDDEREKNRQRKLKAVQNREWDSEKKEEDYNPRGYNPRFRRGAYGGVVAPSSSHGNTTPAAAVAKPVIPKTSGKEQWPDLPGGKQKEKTELPFMASATGTWAEQVENSGPAAPTAAAAAAPAQ